MALRRLYAFNDRSRLGSHLRQFFDPNFWRQVTASIGSGGSRWSLPMLAYTMVAYALSDCRTLSERFWQSRNWAVAVFPKRRRPGATFQGFRDSLSKFGRPLLSCMRKRMQHLAAGLLRRRKYPWPVFAVDGSRIRLPHTRQHERRFGSTHIKNRSASAPQLLLCAAVEIATRMMWDWEVAGGNGSEPELIARIAQRLPPNALLVKDAGTVGYAWFENLLGGGRHILMRVGANFQLWADQVGATFSSGGRVWLCPANNPKARPLELRLIVIVVPSKRGQRRKKTIYLITDVLDERLLSDREAACLYRMRWGASEIGFRSLKQTMEKAALHSRTPTQALLECECALLAMQILSLLHYTASGDKSRCCSLGQASRIWRQAIQFGLSFSRIRTLLRNCYLDEYERKRPKIRRRAPQKKRCDTISPPRLLKRTTAIKMNWSNRLGGYKGVGI